MRHIKNDSFSWQLPRLLQSPIVGRSCTMKQAIAIARRVHYDSTWESRAVVQQFQTGWKCASKNQSTAVLVHSSPRMVDSIRLWIRNLQGKWWHQTMCVCVLDKISLVAANANARIGAYEYNGGNHAYCSGIQTNAAARAAIAETYPAAMPKYETNIMASKLNCSE